MFGYDLNQDVFEGQPKEVVVACVDADGTLKFGNNGAVVFVRRTVKEELVGRWEFHRDGNEKGEKSEWVETRENEYGGGVGASPMSLLRSVDVNGIVFMGNGIHSCQTYQGLLDDVDRAISSYSGLCQMAWERDDNPSVIECKAELLESIQKTILKLTGKKVKKKKIKRWMGLK